MEGLRSVTRSVGELPPELKCPLCKEVMRDAALTSKCCYQSFCDKCKFFFVKFASSSLIIIYFRSRLFDLINLQIQVSEIT